MGERVPEDSISTCFHCGEESDLLGGFWLCPDCEPAADPRIARLNEKVKALEKEVEKRRYAMAVAAQTVFKVCKKCGWYHEQGIMCFRCEDDS